MEYKYFKNENYEDFACGRIIYHKTGYPNYPVRLAGEVFMRCLEYIGKLDDEITIYDCCCGGAYILTVLGMLCNKNIKTIIASDISKEAIELAEDNLSLLTKKGLNNRKEQLEKIYEDYNKKSHFEALESIENILPLIEPNEKVIDVKTFITDMLKSNALADKSFKVDVAITDVPYGNLVSWSKDDKNAINVLLDNLIPILNDNSIVAISSNKSQKINNPNFVRISKIQVGKRKIEFLKRTL